MINPGSAGNINGTVSTLRTNSRRTIRSLVLFSGGIDSTYSLVRLLKETQDLVYAHHVSFIGSKSGSEVTNLDSVALSVREPIAWIRSNLRDFEYSQSLVDLSMFATRARENTSLMYFAAQAAMNYGFSPFDRILLGVNADADPGWHPDSAVYAWRRTLLVRMLRSVWECDEVPHLYFWNPRPSKHAMLEYLPTELARLTFSCSKPTIDESNSGRPVACGSCSRCQWRNRVSRFQDGVLCGDASAVHTPPLCPHPGVGPSKMPIPCH